MTTPPAVFGQFGQTLAFAERTLTRRAAPSTSPSARPTPETWYALQLIATRGPGLAREALSHDLEGSPNLDADSTRELLARLEADGLIRGDAERRPDDRGGGAAPQPARVHRRPADRLLSQFDVDDIETTVRTLQAITARAEEELAVAS